MGKKVTIVWVLTQIINSVPVHKTKVKLGINHSRLILDANTQAQQPTQAVAPSNPNSAQNTLHIAEIRDGIVIMSDGSFRSVVMVKSINFDLMSPQERDGVEVGYQSFLNSLLFPVQIFVHSQKVDLKPYLDKLNKIKKEHDNMLLSLLMEDYVGFIDDLSLQTNIMDKKFYIIIPYFQEVDVQRALTQSKIFSVALHLCLSHKKKITINENDLVKAKDELQPYPNRAWRFTAV